MESLLFEFAVAMPTSFAVAESISADNLITALITFGISLITLVGGELIKFLVAFFKNKTKKFDDENKEEKK